MARAWLLLAAVGLATAAGARDASACGGCFISQSESTVVTGHKMILTVSTQQTTLYDQIVYSGDPASFAWILPIKGQAQIGLSSDALFQNLEQLTQVTVNSPTINCAPPSCGGNLAGAFEDGAGGAGGSGGGGVTVIAEETVGPYETVQLKSSDPNALNTWLGSHGYAIPADVAPVISAYVAEGFDFLALKLVPGKGVSSMRPVRVTTTGASPVLPLRMVAAGTGQITPITLWVLGEGRYETVGAPTFQIDPNQLVWDWDTQKSNYASLKQTAFAQTQNKGWLLEAGEPFSSYNLRYPLEDLVSYDPTSSGYDGDPAVSPEDALAADLATLFAGIDEGSMWVTRLHGELSRAALATDLPLAAGPQVEVPRYFQVTQTTGTAPECPIPAPCGLGDPFGPGGDEPGSTNSCAVSTTDGDAPVLGGLAVAAALAFARRRRAARRAP